MFDQLKKQWDENPMSVMTVGALAVTAIAQFINATSAAKGRRAYAKQVNYRVKHRK